MALESALNHVSEAQNEPRDDSRLSVCVCVSRFECGEILLFFFCACRSLTEMCLVIEVIFGDISARFDSWGNQSTMCFAFFACI